jgi:hypothetical protein
VVSFKKAVKIAYAHTFDLSGINTYNAWREEFTKLAPEDKRSPLQRAAGVVTDTLNDVLAGK